MESNSTIEVSAPESGNAAKIEIASGVKEELRRLSVDGFIAFGHGGLEIGGVLYGARDGARISVVAFAELKCEHALGPSFTLSENDREALQRLLDPPASLETVGWFRSHTRSELALDASDRERFERYFGDGRNVGLVLKPTHWGPASAAVFLREPEGEIVPADPREFTIEAPARKPEAPAAVGGAAGVPEAAHKSEDIPAAAEGLPHRDPAPAPRRRLKLIAGLVLGIAGVASFFWARPSNKLGLQAYAATPGQVRIEWNHDSLPVENGGSAILQIRDGETEKTIPLDRNQLQVSSIVYLQQNSRITVRMRVDSSRAGAPPAEEAIEFVGAPAPQTAEVTPAPVLPPAAAEPVRPQMEERSRTVESADVAAVPKTQRTAPEAPAPAVRKFQAAFPQRTEAPPRETALPAAPIASTAINLESTLPEILRSTPPAVKPASQIYSGPRSGRLIWTGDLSRRGVVEIERDRASVGSLSGALCTVAASYRVSPAEFTRDGLIVYTHEGSANGRREAPAKSNGWNALQFVYDPARAAELVLLEQPSAINNFSRLVVRNDLRPYHVVVIDWTARPESRN